MLVTRKGYIRRFVKMFMKRTGLNYEMAKLNAEYYANDGNEEPTEDDKNTLFNSDMIEYDVVECISDHL